MYDAPQTRLHSTCHLHSMFYFFDIHHGEIAEMTQEDKIIELSSMVAFMHMRLQEFYNKGLYNNNPTRKEIWFMLQESKRTLDKVRSN